MSTGTEMSISPISSLSVITKEMKRSEQMHRKMVSVIIEEVVTLYSSLYNLDKDEGIRLMKEKMFSTLKKAKTSIQMPFMGREEGCEALKYKSGLYTQCGNKVHITGMYCNGCLKDMEKNNLSIPKYGNVEMRLSVGLMDYVDPNGKKVRPYSVFMKKHNISEEKVNEEANKLKKRVDPVHFVIEEKPVKEPKTPKEPKAPKALETEKRSRGRPRKEKTIVEVNNDNQEKEVKQDLFATLVAQFGEETETYHEEVVDKAEESDDEEEEKAVKIKFKGKSYIKSLNTGLIYDYEEYTNNSEQVIVGKWDEKKKTIDFSYRPPTSDIEESDDES